MESGFVLSSESVTFAPTTQTDLEELVEIRIEAMRESLERVGRFDPIRARERFAATFEPDCTEFIWLEDARAGFVVVKATGRELLLDHLYVRPAYQGRGIGAATLARLFAHADARQLPVRVSALKGSASNRFYLRHGFRQVDEGEWDLYYVRPPHPGPNAAGDAQAVGQHLG
jgi:GNAT superfamily N-acetyltransferase